jgi:G3E family GTPase
MSSIPMQLITGFLGSGKTTFLKYYLDQYAGSRKIGIIQNEFSDTNIDGIELKQRNSGFEILEVNNGSVFCVCLLGSFVESLARFIEEVQPDEILLEASGMSDPLSIGQILQSPKLKGKVFLDRVWCLVDAVNFDKITRLQTRVNHQVRIADTVVVNKIDLAENTTEALTQAVKKLNPFAEIQFTSFARVVFKSGKPTLKFIPPGEKAENTRPDLESQVVKSSLLILPEKLDEFLKLIQEECIRCKGYINLTTGKKIFVQGSFERFTLQEVANFSAPTEFVIIGIFRTETSFQKLFDYYCAT